MIDKQDEIINDYQVHPFFKATPLCASTSRLHVGTLRITARSMDVLELRKRVNPAHSSVTQSGVPDALTPGVSRAKTTI